MSAGPGPIMIGPVGSALTCVAFGSRAALDHFDQLLSGGGRQRTELVTPAWRAG